MNKSQIESAKEVLGRLRTLDLEWKMREQLGEGYLTHMLPYNYTVDRILKLYERALHQLEVELESDYAVAIPFGIYIADGQNSGRAATLHEILSGIWKSMANQFDTAGLVNYTTELVQYEGVCGFWDRSERKLHQLDEVRLREQQDNLNRASVKLEGLLASAGALSETQKKVLESLDEFRRLKEQELTVITTLVGKAGNESTQITQLWEQASRQKGEFDKLYVQAEESIKNANAQLEAQKTEYAGLKIELADRDSKLNSTLKFAQDALQEVIDSKAQIQARLNEAAKMLGLSADAALGEKMSKRELEARKGLFWWRIAVGSSVVVAVLWALVVFVCFPAGVGNPYLDILVNLIKTTPGFILMGFIMAQYNKERAIEEEYAFKAAIAMTINAYASLLQEGDSEANKSRQAMLLEAIRQIYSKPKLHRESVKASTYKESTAELMEILKALINKS